jgi:hypothetical protein
MEPILKVLVPKLKEQEPNPGVVVSVLTAIGDLAEVSFPFRFSLFLRLVKHGVLSFLYYKELYPRQ